jgi:hypothetical protein
MVSGLCGRQKKENEKELEEGVGAWINCLLLRLKEGRVAGEAHGRAAVIAKGARLNRGKGAAQDRRERR